MPGLGLPGNDVHASFSDELTSSHWVFPHWPMLMHVLGICEIKGFQNWWHKIMTTGGQHHSKIYWVAQRQLAHQEKYLPGWILPEARVWGHHGERDRAKGLWGGVWKGEVHCVREVPQPQDEESLGQRTTKGQQKLRDLCCLWFTLPFGQQVLGAFLQDVYSRKYLNSLKSTMFKTIQYVKICIWHWWAFEIMDMVSCEDVNRPNAQGPSLTHL